MIQYIERNVLYIIENVFFSEELASIVIEPSFKSDYRL